MKLILNEKEYVQTLLEKGNIDKKPTQALRLIARYHVSNGMNKDQVFKTLLNFMQENYQNFNQVKWEDALISIATKAIDKKKELIIIDRIFITDSELENIGNIKNLRLEKIAFVLLVYSKIYNKMSGNNTYWVNCEPKDVFTDANIAISPNKQDKMIHSLVKLGLISPSNDITSTNLNVIFADESSEIAIEITDFREYVLEYLKWKGEKIGNCECCNKLFKIASNNHKLCDDCWTYNRQSQNREKALRYYNKNKKV